MGDDFAGGAADAGDGGVRQAASASMVAGRRRTKVIIREIFRLAIRYALGRPVNNRMAPSPKRTFSSWTTESHIRHRMRILASLLAPLFTLALAGCTHATTAVCPTHPGGACYAGPGGALYAGPGGPMYAGPGGAAYAGPGGACDAGPGGACDATHTGSKQCPSICKASVSAAPVMR